MKIKILLLICFSILGISSAYSQCTSEKGYADFPFTQNGLTVTASGTGSYQNFTSPYVSCGVNTKPNSVYIGGGGPGSFTNTFSQPVNDMVYNITGSDHVAEGAGEVMTVTVNSGTASITYDYGTCPEKMIITGNVISWVSGASNVGGRIKVHSTSNFTSVTFSHNGLDAGSLFTMCFDGVFASISGATVSTTPVTSITTTTASSGGNVTADGGATVTAEGVCWNTTGSPVLGSSFYTTDGSGLGIFTSSLTGLTPNTTYYVRAYATNSQNTSYGAEYSFTTNQVVVAPSALSYSPSPVVATINTTNVNSSPTITGTVDSYSISPALPTGVTLNTTTGVISGIPTVLSTITNYTVTATNSAGSTTATFTLTVNDIAPTGLSYSPSPVVATINTTTLNSVPTVTGNNVSYSISPALPAGVTLNTTTGVISGKPTVLSTITNYTVTATNTGGSTTATFTLTVNAIPPTALSYSPSPVVATINTTTLNSVPTVTGIIVSYSISPALPAGVTLNTTTGVISGKPTVLSTITNYTVTATNTGGSTTATFTLTVNAIPPTGLSYSPSPVVATINTTNVSSSPTVTGIIVSYSISPALPAGVTLNTTTGVISGTPTVLSAITNYTVTATNTGGSTTATFTLTVNAIAPTNLSVTPTAVVALVNVTSITVTPTVTGIGVVFSISPALPTGVTLNTSTGVVSGIPSVLMALTTYTLTATNTGGSISTTFNLTVTPAAPTATAAQAVCGSGTVNDLVATAPAGSTVRWYTVSSGGTSLATSTALTTATTYYAESWSGVVASSTRTAVVLTINVIPTTPIVVPTSTATNKVKLCPGDYLICSNFDNTLSYQWRLNGTDIAGQTAYQYKVPAGGAGTYSLYVRNPITGCNNLSATAAVDLYVVTTPVIFEKKQSNTISILIVDNRSNLNISYLWTYADGTALPSSIVNNLQFLVLPPSNMAATYMVNITDNNGCKGTSAIKAVTLKATTALAYPALNNGNFKLSLKDAAQGKLNVKIYNQMGFLLKTLSFDNVSSNFEYQINAADLKKGFYIVEISLGDFVQSKKLIIQ